MNPALTPEHLLERLRWRYATKQFAPQRPLAPALLAALEETLVLSASSGGLQPWKFILVTDPATREKLQAASYGQAQVRDASVLVVFAAPKDFSAQDVDALIARTAEVRGIPPETLAGFRAMLVGGIVEAKTVAERQAWAARQTYIALGNLLTSAALLGVDACPMEGFVPAEYDRLLGLDAAGYTATVVCALGYRSGGDPYAAAPKVRFPKESLIVRV
ncbi:MAG: NAD(P)H-dependent oxidoreductase [Verrucomicrobiae bacterium]|nr:NAD(P)H-dependent oxidoreductase [Verrucomicrobiae bacterium]